MTSKWTKTAACAVAILMSAPVLAGDEATDESAASAESGKCQKMMAEGGGKQGKHGCKGHKKKGGHKPPEFRDFDLDADGQISNDEFMEGHSQRFSKMAAEGRKMKHAGKLPMMFEKIDADGDGVLSQDEFDAHVAEMHGKRKH